jgi:hypothetical protein
MQALNCLSNPINSYFLVLVKIFSNKGRLRVIMCAQIGLLELINCGLASIFFSERSWTEAYFLYVFFLCTIWVIV